MCLCDSERLEWDPHTEVQAVFFLCETACAQFERALCASDVCGWAEWEHWKTEEASHEAKRLAQQMKQR